MFKTKKVIIIVSIIVFFLVLFAPIPKNINLDDGSAFTLTSLTYKIVFWDMYKESDKPFNSVEFIIFPKNFYTEEKIWENKSKKLINKGYTAVNSLAFILEKENDYIIVCEIKDGNINKTQTKFIYKDTFSKLAENFEFDTLVPNKTLIVRNINFFTTTHPNFETKIFKISLSNDNSIIFDEDTNTSNDINEVTNQENIISNTENRDNSNNLDTSNYHTSSENITSETPIIKDNYNKPTEKNKSFWFQTIHEYPDNFDEKSQLLIPYIVVEPENYDSTKKYPVILYFHGAGDGYPDKNDIEYAKRFNIQQAYQFNDLYSECYEWLDQAVIIMPQLNNGNWWSFYPEEDGPLDAAMRIFNKVINEYSCDSNRYYVMGPSMGGYATLEVAAKYNDTFAAAMPSCAAWTASQEKANQLKDVPVLFLHGTNDNIVHHSLSQQNYELIKSVGGTMASIKLYDGADHDLWRYSLKDDSVFEWLFSQSK